jgi:hypothetical protein
MKSTSTVFTLEQVEPPPFVVACPDWQGFAILSVAYLITTLTVAWVVPVPKIRITFHGIAAITYALGVFFFVSHNLQVSNCMHILKYQTNKY